MSRFRDIKKGTRALKRVEVPWRDDEMLVCGLRPLLSDEEAGAHADAVAYAKAKGVDGAKVGDPVYELGYRAGVLMRACVDVDSGDAQTPYFESVAEIHAHLDPDRVAMLYEHQEQWQAHCSPRASEMSGAEWFAGVLTCARGEDEAERFFLGLRPVLRASWLRTTADQLVTSLADRSASGSTPSTTTTN